MGELIFIGLGLHDERGISLRGLEEMENAGAIFVEAYTNLMEGLRIKKLEKLARNKIISVSRRMLEEEEGKLILDSARKGKTVFLVPGDPLIATTHVDLRIRAEKAKINTRIIHGASIISAAIGLSGLQNYKFGRSVTIPFPNGAIISELPYEVVQANLQVGNHTLCFLDIKAEESKYMTIKDAIEILRLIEKRRQEHVISPNMLAVGIARAGSEEPIVKADLVPMLVDYDFGKPPHIIIFPGKLHFMEAEALVKFAEAPESIRELTK
ncbi:MAG: diphthine synthase [Candidatus Bathyarchaeota archaeon]|nr:MAG: diphthine synthase [Candidatus Bathyarchaeota archaeon]